MELVLYLLAAIAASIFVMLLLPKKSFRSWSHLSQTAQALKEKTEDRRFQLPYFKLFDARLFTDEARSIGMDIPGSIYLYGAIACGALVGTLFKTPLTIVVGGITGAIIIWIWLDQQKEKYQEKIEQQTLQLIQTVSIIYGMDRNLLNALEEAYNEAEEPMKEYLGQLIQNYRGKKPLKECLDEMSQQINVPGFNMFSSVLQVLERSGSEATDVMKNVSQIIQNNQYMREEIKGDLKGLKQDNRMMICIGFLYLVGFRFMLTTYYETFANTMFGQALIGGMFLYMVWSVRMVNSLSKV